MWFGTWNGLNRYDGYKFKVFRHELGNPKSLSGAYVYSLFKDHSGNLWVGTDGFLDRFDPETESFTHYKLDQQSTNGLSSIVNHISQDSSGKLWLSTSNGLFRLDPKSGDLKKYIHSPADPTKLGDSAIKSTGEDKEGNFWVATSRALDEFDRQAGKVKRHIEVGESGIGLLFHEDRFGVFWVIYGSLGYIGTLDRRTNRLTRYEYEWKVGPAQTNQAYSMLEDSDGTMWFGTGGAGLMKFDRQNRRFVSYRHDPNGAETIGENRVIALFATPASSSLEQAFSNLLSEVTAGRGRQLRIFVQGELRTLNPAIQQQLFLVGREAVVNALRHSEATEIEVEVQYLVSPVRVLIRDNGCGINPEAAQKESDSHRGLRGMRERAENIGARFGIWSRTGAGTEVRVAVPVDAAKQTTHDRGRWEGRREI
jgi:anti-sigma regulatory factor (Ser/Thr protein kinase)